MQKKAAFLAAMANPVRLSILSLLVTSELPVNALAKKVGLSQSALSQHLARLRLEGLVTTRRVAQTIYYQSRSQSVIDTLAVLNGSFGSSKNWAS